MWAYLPLPVYQSCLKNENFKDPVTVTVVNTLFSQRSLNHLRNHFPQRKESLSAIEVDKCPQALAKTYKQPASTCQPLWVF